MRAHTFVLTSAVALSVLICSESVHARAAGRRLGRLDIDPPDSETVVVLGYRNRSRRANYLNRYRVRAGLRSFDPGVGEQVLVLCGGCVRGMTPEAELMATYARERGFTGEIRRDVESATTWENIQNAIPHIEASDSIKIVSNSFAMIIELRALARFDSMSKQSRQR